MDLDQNINNINNNNLQNSNNYISNNNLHNNINNNNINDNSLNDNVIHNNESENNINNNESSNQNNNNNESSNQNNNQISIDINYFKQILKEYLKLEEEITTLKKALSQRRNKQSSLNQCLLTFLNSNNINEVQLEGNYQGQQLKPSSDNKTKNPNRNDILKVVEEKLKNNPELLKNIKQEINKLKETFTVEKVKISKIKINQKPKQKSLKESSNESNNLLLNN